MEVQCPDNRRHEDLGLGNDRNDLLLGRLPTKNIWTFIARMYIWRHRYARLNWYARLYVLLFHCQTSVMSVGKTYLLQYLDLIWSHTLNLIQDLIVRNHTEPQINHQNCPDCRNDSNTSYIYELSVKITQSEYQDFWRLLVENYLSTDFMLQVQVCIVGTFDHGTAEQTGRLINSFVFCQPIKFAAVTQLTNESAHIL